VSSINLLENNIDAEVIDHVGSESELIDYYDRSNLFVSPSLYEGFGMPLVEALSRGCKVLCTDIEVFREVGKDYVEYFSPDDPPALLRLIVDRLNRPNREMTNNNFFESYKWSNITKDLVSYFNQYRLH
jgi:glycosyltransferase involved in cell wall biosynthesis